MCLEHYKKLVLVYLRCFNLAGFAFDFGCGIGIGSGGIGIDIGIGIGIGFRIGNWPHLTLAFAFHIPRGHIITDENDQETSIVHVRAVQARVH